MRTILVHCNCEADAASMLAELSKRGLCVEMTPDCEEAPRDSDGMPKLESHAQGRSDMDCSRPADCMVS